MLDKNRIRRFHAALSGAKLLDYKADMLAGCGVTSTTDLTAEQADDLIMRLNAMQQARKTEAPPQVRRKRSTVLTLINSLGIYADNGDWTRVNKYLLDPRIAGKLLYEMNEIELTVLNRKLRSILRQKKENEEEDNYLATNN